MGVHQHGGTMTGAVTPICDNCGVSLCWDISRTEFLEAKPFWEEWTCQDCNGARLSAQAWRLENGRDALPSATQEIVAVFETAHPEYCLRSDASSSQERLSKEASSCFSAALTSHGISNRISDIPLPGGGFHSVVIVGEFTIDWTATQHDEDAPFPLVYRTLHGWPIEAADSSKTAEDKFLERLAEMTEEEIDRLVAIVAAKRLAAAKLG